ncbi:MAG: hypothetical protein IBJ08_17750, partial [Pseudomonas sp.]|nr:hypothetical protein [Pseudomonas sp.]
ISTSTVLVLSYATLQRSVPAFEQPGPLHSLTSQLPTLLRAIALG